MESCVFHRRLSRFYALFALHSFTEQAGRQKDPMRELAHALDLLKAYAENSGGSDAAAASTSTTGSVNVAA
jgi:hypothetical protein